jgi:class 3 adenylate cyclase/pimeloyl-ACP methyl ester carboxylesterase
MEPEVRYCTTTDGVRIAYAIRGSGPPLLYGVEPITSHVQLEWSHVGSGRILRAHAQHNTLIRLDFRGSGLSDRVLPQTVDDEVLDLEAVVERSGFECFALYANLGSTLPAIVYAARHPERVTRMVIVDGYARARDILNTPQIQALLAAAKIDWAMATEAVAFAAYGSGRDENKEHGKFIRACVGPESFSEVNLEILSTLDVAESARAVQAPTLVMRHDGLQFITMEMTKELVTLIPNAQLAIIEGTWSDNVEAMVDRAVAFINPESEVTRPPVRPQPLDSVRAEALEASGTAIILFADIADSTALTERLGDTAFRAKARDLDAALRTVIRDHAGTPIEGKLLGDGVLAVFTSARQAIEAALACGSAGASAGMPLHLGLHAGDVIREENNVYGGAVNIASRISGLSAPGEVLVSDIVRGLARTSAGVQFEDRGEQSLKGVGEPVRVWAVREA